MTQGDKGDLKPTATAPALGTDPMLQYQTAAALYQDVKMLNRYVTDAVVGEGASAYVVHLKVSISPKMHNLPYDAYTEISFLPSDIEHPESCPGTVEIEPLFATENLEALQSSRSREAAQQMALALTAMIGAYGTAGDASRVDHRLHDILGRDYNSTLNVSRLSASTALVRFGAVQNTLSNYAMMNKENRVTLLVIYRPYKVDHQHPINCKPAASGTATTESGKTPAVELSKRLTVVARTDFVNTITGVKVPVKEDVQRVKGEYQRLMKQYYIAPKICLPLEAGSQPPDAPSAAGPATGGKTPSKVKNAAEGKEPDARDYIYRLAMSATRNDYAYFHQQAQYLWPKLGEPKCNPNFTYPIPEGLEPYEIELYTSALWVDMLHINAGNQFSYDHMDITLPGTPAFPVLPEEQTVFMTNDDSGAQASLLRGKALKTDMLRAKLVGRLASASPPSANTRGRAVRHNPAKGNTGHDNVGQGSSGALDLLNGPFVTATDIAIDKGGKVAITFPDVNLVHIDTTQPATLFLYMPKPKPDKYRAAEDASPTPCLSPPAPVATDKKSASPSTKKTRAKREATSASTADKASTVAGTTPAETEGPTTCIYHVTFVPKAKEEPVVPAFAISLPSSSLQTADRTGTLQIVIDATKSKDATPLFLKIANADYGGCSAIGGMAVPLKESGARPVVVNAGSCKLDLSNLHPGRPVSITLVDKDGKIYGAAVVAGVVAAAAAPAKTGG